MTVQGKPMMVDSANRFEGTLPVTSGTTTVVLQATDGSGNQAINTYEIDQMPLGSLDVLLPRTLHGHAPHAA